MAQPILKVENISKSFGRINILKDISLDIMPGEILGIIGASGSGKTTLLNSLIGFFRPETGDVKFYSDTDKNKPEYKSIYNNKYEAKHLYGFAAQHPSFYENLTVRENLEYFGKLYDLDLKILEENIRTLLKIMNLDSSEHVLASNLSGGMERRLDISCALVHNPKVLILDEPTADLDPALRNHIIKMISKINKQGTTVILSSHHLEELETMCNRVAIIKNNKIIAIGNAEELKKKYSKYEEILLKSSPGNYDKVGKLLFSKFKSTIKGSKEENKELILYCEDPKRHLSNIIKAVESCGETIMNLKFSRPTLDQIFININTDINKQIKPSNKVIKKVELKGKTKKVNTKK